MYQTNSLSVTSPLSMKNSITARLLRIVFSIYLFIAITVTLVHMVAEYYNTREDILNDLKIFQETFEANLTETIWQFDNKQLEATLKGMLKIPIIVGVMVKDYNAVTIAAIGNIPDLEGQAPFVDSETNQRPVRDVFSKLLPHTFRVNHIDNSGDKYFLGYVTIYSSTAIVLQKVRYGFLFILINAVIKTVALWIISLWIGRNVLSRPLLRLTTAVQNLDLDHLENDWVSVRTKGENELKILEIAFNRAIDKIKQQHQIVTRQNEELKQLDKMKDEFISNVSHELRTPLMGIQGFAELLAMDAVEDEEQKQEYYRNILTDSQRLIRVLNNVINLSQLESGSMNVVFETVNMAKLMKQLKWKTNLEALLIDAPEKFEFESNGYLLEMALEQLVHNGSVFNKNEPEVHLRVETNQDRIRFSVSDNGIGIPEAHLPHIFEKFYRVDSGIKYEVKGGVGLGLAVVHHAVELLNGTVSVESSVGEGSVFTVEIPGKPSGKEA